MRIIALILFITILLLTHDILLAQPGLPDGPSQAPIDGGLTFLVAAGGAYALKKIKERNQEN
jgi:hypothetical protein